MDLKSIFKVPYDVSQFWNNSSLENDASDSKAMGLGAVTGIFIALSIDWLLSYEYKYKSGVLFKHGLSKILNANNFLRTFVLCVVVLSLPFLVILLLLASAVKVLCAIIIKKKDKYFVSFLDSFDVFWSLEEDSTKSVINVLGVIESDSPYAIADNIKEKLKKIIHNNGTEKIFYRRNEKYGFYYWRRHSHIDMNQYVEIVESSNKNECLEIIDLQNLMADLQNESLPYEDKGLFKILITRQRVGNYNEARGDYGIIFRIHHSIGDGVALIEFLCQTFAESNDSSTMNKFSMPETCNNDTPQNLINMIQKLLEIPVCFVDGILRKPDRNALHGTSLVGKKVFKWTESDESLLTLVKEIKDNVEQVNFTDVLVTALSRGLRDFLSEKMTPVPDDVAVVLPIRFPKHSNGHDLILKNDFSVTILDVPINEIENLSVIRDRCIALRESADPLTNYFFLKLVCNSLPRAILNPLLNSSQATMVFSNMPGPGIINLCGGNTLKSLVFFVPHKGTTGLGVTSLCYGGVLRFAVMADEALVSSSDELSPILDGMVEEIKRLHRQYVQ